MSTLNTIGFNVRRKRQQDGSSFSSSKGKILPSKDISSGLAFTAMPPPSKPSVKKASTTYLAKSKRPSPKDLKQSTLLPYFTTAKPDKPLRLLEKNDTTTSTPLTTLQITKEEEENEICVIRRHVRVIEILPMLMEAFHGYNNNDIISTDRPLYHPQDTPDNVILLPLKSKYSETMDCDPDTTTTTGQRRRRRRNDDDRSTATLHTAFARSVSLKPVKKRLCPSNKEQHDHLGAIEDELDRSQCDEDKEIKMVRRCLSTHQVNALLLDIANEVFAFDNNTWCTSYLG